MTYDHDLRIQCRQVKITQIEKVFFLKYFLLRILRDSMDYVTNSMRRRQTQKFERAGINISLFFYKKKNKQKIIDRLM